MAVEFEFPFVGAGDASYFEWAEVHVLFAREPRPKEKAAIRKQVPAPLRDSIDFAKSHLMVASGQFAHVAIAETYPGDDQPDDAADGNGDDDGENEEGRFFFATPLQVTRFNEATDAWLRFAHTQCPIVLAYRGEDFEGGGTALSRWHKWSTTRVLDVVKQFDLDRLGERPEAFVLRGALAMAATAKVKLPTACKEFLSPEAKLGAALAKGSGLRPLIAKLADEDLELLRGEIDLKSARHRLALVEASTQLLARLDGDIELLVPLAVAAVQTNHTSKVRVLAAVRANAKYLGDDLHAAAWALYRANLHDQALELFEAICTAANLHPAVYTNALGLVVGKNGRLRIAAARARTLLKHCLPHAKSNATIHHNAACAFLALGDRGAALKQVELAVKGGYDITLLAGDATLRALRKEPRWIAAMTKQTAAKRRR